MLLSSTKLWFESTVFQTRRRKATRPDDLSWRECTPANSRIQLFCVAHTRQEIFDVWRGRNTVL